jgi:hypothetical protein
MLERITPKDLLDMANPSTCKNYILVIGGAFEQYFRSIDVVPVVRGAKDSKTIYFQRADVLTSSTPTKNPATDKLIQAQRQEICVALGYFFTRFFQIFAALALSVFDSEMVRQGSSVLGQLGEYKGLVGGPAGLGGPVLAGPGLAVRGGGGEQMGGELDAGRLGNYKFLANYLSESGRIKFGTSYAYPFKKYTNMYFTLKSASLSEAYLLLSTGNSLFESQRDFILIHLYKPSNQRVDDFKIKVLGARKIEKGKEASKYNSAETITQFDNLFLKFTLDSESRRVYVTSPLNGSNDDPKIGSAFYLLAKHIKNNYDKLGIGEILEPLPSSESEAKYERAYNNGWGERRARTDTVPASIRPIYDAVSASYKPVAHCVARSLQLLQLDALRSMGGRAANSFICNYRFLAPNPTGLPRPGEAVTTSPGIAAMGTLYNVFVDGAPRLTDASKKEYLDLLRAFGAIFESPVGDQNPRLDQIKDNWEKTLCGRIASSLGRKDVMAQQITLGAKQIGIASEGVKKLWSRQLEHVREVDKLFALMFMIDRDRKINIHPNILKGGIPGLDAIAAAARQVLAKYYVDCEASYKETVGKIVGMPVVVPMAAAAAAAAAPKAVAAPAAAAAPQAAARAPVGPQQPPQLVQRQ